MSVCKRKGGRWCSAPNCKNNSNINKDISFFSFPKDEQRARKWTVYCRREDLLKKDAMYLNKNCTICSVHFEDSMFLNFLRNRLKPDAVPTLFSIPNPPKQISLKRKAPSERISNTCLPVKKAKIDGQVIMEQIKIEVEEFGSDADTFSNTQYGIANGTPPSFAEPLVKIESQVIMEEIKIESEECGLEAKFATENEVCPSFTEVFIKPESQDDAKATVDNQLQDEEKKPQVKQTDIEEQSNQQIVNVASRISKADLQNENIKFACDPSDNSHKKPFVCNICNNSYTQKATLNRHMFSHTGQRPFTCSLCSKSFSQKSDLSRHIIIHSGEKPFTCNVCNRAFYQKSDMNTHLRIHTGQRPFKCNICGKSFGRKFHAKAHMMTHAGKEPLTIASFPN